MHFLCQKKTMKRTLFFITCLTMTLVSACRLEKETVSNESLASAEGRLCELHVRAEIGRGSHSPNNADDKESKTTLEDCHDTAIRSLQILIFRKDGQLDAYQQADGQNISIKCTTGERSIYAFANCTSLSHIRHQEELHAQAILLKDSSPSALPMWCKSQVVIYGNSDIQLELERLVCKITLKKICTRFPKSLQDGQMRIKRIFLANAVCAYNIKDEILEWANQIVYKSEGGAMLHDDFDEQNGNALTEITLSSQDDQELNLTYYCFPNPTMNDSHQEAWCERYTRLIIEADWEMGTQQTRVFYPIPLAHLQGNHSYIIDQYNITRIGLEHAWDNPEILHPDIEISIAPWAEEHKITESL